MQSFPQCTVWIRVRKNWVRCRPCSRFLFAVDYMCATEPQLRMAYDMKFQGNANGRRAFTVRSHEVLPAELIQWIKAELQNVESHLRSLPSQKHTSHLCPPGLEQTISNNDEPLQRFIADVLVAEQNETSAEMYPVHNFTQEIIHCHVTMSNQSTMHCYPARCNLSCHVVSSEV